MRNNLLRTYASEHVKLHLERTPDGNRLICDDTLLDKRYTKEIALARPQYSGNAGKTIKGIGIVTCVYVNSVLDRYWLIDDRLYHKQDEGNQKVKIPPVPSSRRTTQVKCGLFSEYLWQRLKSPTLKIQTV
ncbi:MAG: hypothetical protein OXI63_24620 [Candidatus Poribacteria bacterium]|nr:hypothetical protein [Candidatus Poribacteria bacterium]